MSYVRFSPGSRRQAPRVLCRENIFGSERHTRLGVDKLDISDPYTLGILEAGVSLQLK
jgi:hypothetical protein